MEGGNSRRYAVAIAVAAALLFIGVSLGSGNALAATPTGSATPKTIDYSTVWHGNANHDPPHAPDVMVLPTVPAGTWWEITKIQLTGHYNEAKSFRQTNFLFTRFVPILDKHPEMWDANLDVLAHLGKNPGTTGTFVGAGGVGNSPDSSWDWTQFAQPITLNSGIAIVLGSSMGVGNYVTVTVDYESLGPCTTVVEYGYPALHGGTLTIKVGPAPAGTKWYLENAFGSIIAGSGGQGREVVYWFEPSGLTLVKGTDYPYKVNVRNTGGYSMVQTGPALNQYGTQVVWTSPVWISGSEYISVSFTGQSSDQTEYAFEISQMST